jgi:zinc/manganese transport system substrate-binding protein
LDHYLGGRNFSVRRSTFVISIARIAIVVAVFAALLVTGTGSAAAQDASPSPNAGFPEFSPLTPLPDAAARDDGPLEVVATTPIIADLVRQVGGQRVEVESILPNNADPHDFEPKPEDIIKVEDADVVFTHGLHLDEWASDLIDNSGTGAPVFVVTDGIETLDSEEEEFEEGDPHVWFDTTRAQQMVTNIANALTEVDADGSDSYQQRANAYIEQLATLDQEIKDRIALIPEDQRKIVTNHDALGYYADRYGLEVVGTVFPGSDTRSEPSAQEVADLVDSIEEQGVKAVFAENTVSPTIAEELASEAGVQVVDDLYTDSLGDAGSGADTYIGLMQTDTRLIVDALRA